MRRLIILISILCLSGILHSTIINVPDDQPTIQDGINAAARLYDTVLVAPGDYVENIDFLEKTVVVLSSGGPGVTSITPVDPYIATIVISNIGTGGSQLAGFTIQGSRYTAISCLTASPIIKENIFTDNIGPAGNDQLGGSITCYRSGGLKISENVFVANGSRTDVANVLFIECLGSNTTMAYNLIYSTVSGQSEIKTDSTYLNFINNTLVAGVDYGLDLPYTAFLENNIITSADVYGIYFHAVSGPEEYFEYNCFYGNGEAANFTLSGTNIFEDPLFVDAGTGDFTLSEGSPCIDGGNPDYQYYEEDDTPIDMGAFHYPQKPLPTVTTMAILNEDLTNVVNHTPQFVWGYTYDGGDQTGYEIEVGSDDDWSVAELWSPGQITSTDHYSDYTGAAMEDGTDYFVRLRVAYNDTWGRWKEISFHMNSVPSIPDNDSPPDGGTVLRSRYRKLSIPRMTHLQFMYSYTKMRD